MADTPKYTFNSFNVRHGYMGGAIVELNKSQVWEAIKNDKDFWQMKLYEIKVEQTDHTIPGITGGYTWPGRRTFITGRHWARSKAEAKKIGEVIRQIHPTPLKANQ